MVWRGCLEEIGTEASLFRTKFQVQNYKREIFETEISFDSFATIQNQFLLKLEWSSLHVISTRFSSLLSFDNCMLHVYRPPQRDEY